MGPQIEWNSVGFPFKNLMFTSNAQNKYFLKTKISVLSNIIYVFTKSVFCKQFHPSYAHTLTQYSQRFIHSNTLFPLHRESILINCKAVSLDVIFKNNLFLVSIKNFYFANVCNIHSNKGFIPLSNKLSSVIYLLSK